MKVTAHPAQEGPDDEPWPYAYAGQGIVPLLHWKVSHTAEAVSSMHCKFLCTFIR